MPAHAAPSPIRKPSDGRPMSEQTADLADTIETALADVGGDSPLCRMMADHAARAVQGWIDYQLQVGTLRPAPDEPPTTPITLVG